MNNPQILRFLALTAMFISTCLISCDTGNSPSIIVPQPPSELKANSLSSSSIGLSWKASRTNVIGYDVEVYDEFGTTMQVLKLGPVTSARIMNINEGKLYTFRVYSRSVDTISRFLEIKWATASRFSGRLYVGPGRQNGLNVLEQRTYNIDKAASWDICLEADSSSGQINYHLSTPFASSISDVNGMVLSGTDKGKKVRATELFNDVSDPFIFTGIDSLQQLYFSAPIGQGFTPLQNMADKIEGFTRGFVLAFRTQQGNHVLFHVKEKNLQIIQRDPSGTYIEFEASVQKTQNLPYAKIN
ncbi:MAG: fibronectin type III domain-containing protein [bacterium]